MTTISAMGKSSDGRSPATGRMPALFIGHGSPMNAVEDNAYSRAWAGLGAELSRPRAILCVSAHWETQGTRVTAMPSPRTIHDFSGFPEVLNRMEYRAPGSPELAETVRRLVGSTPVAPDETWGLDHGAWAVLCRMYPNADIPIVQLSLDRALPPRRHYEIGRELAPLRDQGVLVVGSGNMVHNLRLMEWSERGFDWADRFDARLRDLLVKRAHDALIDYEALGPDARRAIPTSEHYLPLLYILALQGADERPRFFAEGVTLGSISMRGVCYGGRAV